MVSLPAWATPLTSKELDTLFQRYRGLTELSVDFEQTKILKDVATPLVSKGHLLVRTPNELVWTITSPSFLEVKMQDGSVQITSGKGPKADIQKLSRAQLASNPQSRSLDSLSHWLQFDSKFLNSEYQVEKLGANRYKFNPKGESPFASMTAEILADNTVRKIEMNEKSGDQLQIKFANPLIIKKNAHE